VEQYVSTMMHDAESTPCSNLCLVNSRLVSRLDYAVRTMRVGGVATCPLCSLSRASNAAQVAHIFLVAPRTRTSEVASTSWSSDQERYVYIYQRASERPVMAVKNPVPVNVHQTLCLLRDQPSSESREVVRKFNRVDVLVELERRISAGPGSSLWGVRDVASGNIGNPPGVDPQEKTYLNSWGVVG
jgi:hypothetical protein